MIGFTKIDGLQRFISLNLFVGRMVKCLMFAPNIESRKLLVLNLDSLIKHLRVKKCIMAKPRVVVSAYFFNPTNAHVKNEKLYASIGQDTIVTQVANARKVE